MGKASHKINASRFLEDYRAGKSDQELMADYKLTPQTLEKLLQKLRERDMLHSGEMRAAPYPETVAFEPLASASPTGTMSHPEKPFREHDRDKQRTEMRREESSKCPQCGAAITSKMLLCAECGHMLPGEERWENVEPKKRLIDRIPPKVLGSIVALPFAIALLYVFTEIIIPMALAVADKRSQTTEQSKRAGREVLRGEKATGQRAAVPEHLASVVKELIDANVFSDANPDFTGFTTGPAWEELSEDQRLDHLDALRMDMLRVRTKFQFTVVDPGGKIIGRATENSVSLIEEEQQ
ncbi:MAG: hypothetical protein AB1733_19745 [Thermodesulfobacteriota bacterium]